MAGSAARRREDELARLRADADAARARLEGTVTRIRGEVRDPWGVRTAITSRPLVTAGVATGVGLAFAKLVLSRKSSEPNAPTRLEIWAGRLLDGGIQVLKPLGRVYLKQWLAQFAPVAESSEPTASAA